MRISIGGGRDLGFVDAEDEGIAFAHEAVEVGDGAGEAFAELDFRLPTQMFARFFDVRLALLRIVAWQRLEDELRAGAGEIDHGFGELADRELVWVADIDRAGEFGGR